MKTKALRLYGKEDLRLEEFEFPEMQDDEIIAEVISDSLCMSSYKASELGADHKKVPNDVHENPVIIGHEFCGRILKVGKKWAHKYKEGDKFVIQPNLGVEGGLAPGYSYRYIGGDATKIVIPNVVMENDCLLEYNGKSYFEGSLVEPLSCVIGAFNANFHMAGGEEYEHKLGIREGGNLILLGATGPMGFLAIDLALHGSKKPKNLVVTGIIQEKIDLASKLYTEEEAKKQGINLKYVNTSDIKNDVEYLRGLTEDNHGYDDVFVFAPVKPLVESASGLLAYDGCLNFFAGPVDKKFSSQFNFYDVHYNLTHVVGTSGGNTKDMKQALRLIESGDINVAKIATHILGLNDAAKTTLSLPNIPGGKKVVYTHKSLELTEIENMKNISDNDFIKELSKIVDSHDGLWNAEAEEYLIKYAPQI